MSLALQSIKPMAYDSKNRSFQQQNVQFTAVSQEAKHLGQVSKRLILPGLTTIGGGILSWLGFAEKLGLHNGFATDAVGVAGLAGIVYGIFSSIPVFKRLGQVRLMHKLARFETEHGYQ